MIKLTIRTYRLTDCDNIHTSTLRVRYPSVNTSCWTVVTRSVSSQTSRLTNVCSDANRRHSEAVGASVYYHKLRLLDAMVRTWCLAVRRLGQWDLKSAVRRKSGYRRIRWQSFNAIVYAVIKHTKKTSIDWKMPGRIGLLNIIIIRPKHIKQTHLFPWECAH